MEELDARLTALRIRQHPGLIVGVKVEKLECELTVKAGRVVWDINGISRPLWTENESTASR